MNNKAPNTNIAKFSDTDTKLLITLCTEMTAEDACISSGTAFEYGRQRIRNLKKHGWITFRVEGNKHYYRTANLPALEHLYKIAETRTSTSPLCRIPNYYGQNPTLTEAIKSEVERTANLKSTEMLNTLPKFVGAVVNKLRRNSHRIAHGELQNQPPDAQTMKRWLEEYINQTKRNLRLAEEVLSTRKLWEESPTVWKWIAEEPPGEAARKQAEELLNIYTGGAE